MRGRSINEFCFVKPNLINLIAVITILSTVLVQPFNAEIDSKSRQNHEIDSVEKHFLHFRVKVQGWPLIS